MFPTSLRFPLTPSIRILENVQRVETSPAGKKGGEADADAITLPSSPPGRPQPADRPSMHAGRLPTVLDGQMADFLGDAERANYAQVNHSSYSNISRFYQLRLKPEFRSLPCPRCAYADPGKRLEKYMLADSAGLRYVSEQLDGLSYLVNKVKKGQCTLAEAMQTRDSNRIKIDNFLKTWNVVGHPLSSNDALRCCVECGYLDIEDCRRLSPAAWRVLQNPRVVEKYINTGMLDKQCLLNLSLQQANKLSNSKISMLIDKGLLSLQQVLNLSELAALLLSAPAVAAIIAEDGIDTDRIELHGIFVKFTDLISQPEDQTRR